MNTVVNEIISSEFLKKGNEILSTDKAATKEKVFELMVSVYKFKDPGELVILDRWCYNLMKMKTLQEAIHVKGEVLSYYNEEGVEINTANPMNRDLFALMKELRADESQLMISTKDRLKKAADKAGQDFSKFMESIVDTELEDG